MSKENSLCNSCPKRATCTQLCKEAEQFANQDKVKQKEVTTGLILTEKKEWPTYNSITKTRLSYISKCKNLTPLEHKLLRFLVVGFNKKEIINTLNISEDSYWVHTHSLRKKFNKS